MPHAVAAAHTGGSLVERSDALLQAVPAEVQQAANAFACTSRDEGRGLMGWMTDATARLGSKPIVVHQAPDNKQKV